MNNKGPDQTARCAGWSGPLLFAYDIRHIFSWPGSYIFSLSEIHVLPITVVLHVCVCTCIYVPGLHSLLHLNKVIFYLQAFKFYNQNNNFLETFQTYFQLQGLLFYHCEKRNIKKKNREKLTDLKIPTHQKKKPTVTHTHCLKFWCYTNFWYNNRKFEQ